LVWFREVIVKDFQSIQSVNDLAQVGFRHWDFAGAHESFLQVTRRKIESQTCQHRERYPFLHFISLAHALCFIPDGQWLFHDINLTTSTVVTAAHA
jgi:hypothetical protein